MSETLRTARVPALEEVPGLVHGFEQRVAAAARDELSLADEPGKRDDAITATAAGSFASMPDLNDAVHVTPSDGMPM